MAIQGGDDQGNTIRINLASYNGVGTYETGSNMSNFNTLSYIELPQSLWGNDFASNLSGQNPGTVEITEVTDDYVKGSFSFDGYNAADMTSKVFTNGTFQANF